MNLVWSLVKKELRIEVRAKDSLLSMVIFGVSIILLFSFAFPINSQMTHNNLPGLVWITILFIFSIGLFRNFSREKEWGGMNMMLAAPLDRGQIFLAKLFTFILFLLIADVVLIMFFSLFMNFPGAAYLQFWGLTLLVNWALSSIGVLASGIGFKSKMGEVLTSLLLFPFAVPVLIGAVRSTASIMDGNALTDYGNWIMIIFTFAVSFTLAGLFLYDQILED